MGNSDLLYLSFRNEQIELRSYLAFADDAAAALAAAAADHETTLTITVRLRAYSSVRRRGRSRGEGGGEGGLLFLYYSLVHNMRVEHAALEGIYEGTGTRGFIHTPLARGGPPCACALSSSSSSHGKDLLFSL